MRLGVSSTMHLAGTPLHRPPGTSLSPCCMVIITPVIHPGSRGLQQWCKVVGIVCWPFRSRLSRFSLKIKVKDLISIIQHERKKKKLIMAQTTLIVIWAALCTSWLVCGNGQCCCALCGLWLSWELVFVIGVGVVGSVDSCMQI